MQSYICKCKYNLHECDDYKERMIEYAELMSKNHDWHCH